MALALGLVHPEITMLMAIGPRGKFVHDESHATMTVDTLFGFRVRCCVDSTFPVSRIERRHRPPIQAL
jgi:hypothetical protein